MSLFEKINQDLKDAMKNKDENRLSALRMARTELTKKQKESADIKLTDELVVLVLQSLAKKYEESIDQFRKGNREDLAVKEEAQLKVLETYLPEKISVEEIRGIVNDVIAETGAMSKRDFGKVMGQVMRRLKETGKLVDGATVKDQVNAALTEPEESE